MEKISNRIISATASLSLLEGRVDEESKALLCMVSEILTDCAVRIDEFEQRIVIGQCWPMRQRNKMEAL